MQGPAAQPAFSPPTQPDGGASGGGANESPARPRASQHEIGRAPHATIAHRSRGQGQHGTQCADQTNGAHTCR